MHFDVVHAADPRFAGGTSAALRAELKAAARHGLSTALLPFSGIRGKLTRAFERRTAALIDQLGVPWICGDEEATCDVLFAHHPQIFERMPARPVLVRPKRVVCVVAHPPFDGAWTPQYDFAVVERNLERLFGAPVIFAPVGPAVRRQFETQMEMPRLLRRDLTPMIDMAEWPDRHRAPPGKTATIGRHSRPHRLKWPDSREELLAAYPDERHLAIHALGGVPSEVKPWIGSNWSLLPFSDVQVQPFLGRLDYYVYYHSRRWVEAFGIAIAEAMASGLIVILDPAYEALFGDGALYADTGACADLIDKSMAAPAVYSRQSSRARAVAAERFSIATYASRMAEVYDDLEIPPAPALKTTRIVGGIPPPAARAWRIATRRRALFVATNGIGLGHITRLMAIAERCSSDLQPVFFTRSAGSALIAERGHAVDYIPWTVKLGVTDESWNRAYEQELVAAIECMDISAVVFDGTYPFAGLVKVAAARPDLCWVWVRRALWVPGQRLNEELQYGFDMVIEPGEIAHDEDGGPTRGLPGPIVAVAPILLTDPGAALSRGAAAQRLGIDPARRTVAVQLGSQANFDFENLPALIHADLAARDVQIVKIDNPLARPSARDEWPTALRRTVYPLAPCLPAIDAMITNAGYNSFHECIHAGVPTIFVPNEAPEMDDQHLRATYAHAAGLGLRLRASETGRVRATIDTALSDGFRDELRRRAARLGPADGAAEAARAIEQLVFSVRTNARLQSSIARA